jgi:hypothetical protein
MPNDRVRPFGLSTGKFATRKQTPQGGSVEASNLHEATSAGRPSCPSEATLPRGMRHSAYRGTSLGIHQRARAEHAPTAGILHGCRRKDGPMAATGTLLLSDPPGVEPDVRAGDRLESAALRATHQAQKDESPHLAKARVACSNPSSTRFSCSDFVFQLLKVLYVAHHRGRHRKRGGCSRSGGTFLPIGLRLVMSPWPYDADRCTDTCGLRGRTT